MKQYYENILDSKLPVSVHWMVENNSTYPPGQVKEVVAKETTDNYTVLIPRTGQLIKSLKIDTTVFPGNLDIEKVVARYPSLQDFKEESSLIPN